MNILLNRINITLSSPFLCEEMASIIEDAMVAGVPVNSLIEVCLLEIATGRYWEYFIPWYDRQIDNPCIDTSMYLAYTGISHDDLYQTLYLGLNSVLVKHFPLQFINGQVINCEIIDLNDTILRVLYVTMPIKPEVYTSLTDVRPTLQQRPETPRGFSCVRKVPLLDSPLSRAKRLPIY